jgi:hypothetical protein
VRAQGTQRRSHRGRQRLRSPVARRAGRCRTRRGGADKGEPQALSRRRFCERPRARCACFAHAATEPALHTSSKQMRCLNGARGRS